RIVAFVDQHAESLGYLSPLAMTPRQQLPAGHAALRPAARAPSDVAPLEALRVPAELDGSAGLNRTPVPAHQAELNTDLQAVRAGAEIRSARSEATRRAYRREAERLLLWAIVAKRKPLSFAQHARRGRIPRAVPGGSRLQRARPAHALP
ncbi:hypothetical protein ACS0Y6_38520, partial [Burkholderia gladioli]